MTCIRNLKSEKHLKWLVFVLLSLVYIYLCSPLHVSACPGSGADSTRHIFQGFDEDDGPEDDEHFLIPPFSKSNIYAILQKMRVRSISSIGFRSTNYPLHPVLPQFHHNYPINCQ